MKISHDKLTYDQAAYLNELEKDRERMDWLENHLLHSKWEDVLPALRPRDNEGFPIAKYIGEKYIGEDGVFTLRYAIDQQLKK